MEWQTVTDQEKPMPQQVDDIATPRVTADPLDVAWAEGQHHQGPAHERLGIMVGAAYGTALWERDQARDVADRLAAQLSEGLRHLDSVLKDLPTSSFAGTNDDREAARAWLAATVGSSDTPEQEPTT